MITNNLNLPKPFVDAATSDYQYKPKRYSVTEVIGGTCEAILKRRHKGEAEEDVADRVWAIFGTAVHKVLQEAEAEESQLQENWISAEVGNGYTLSGIFDLYDAETQTVTDYKTCSVWKVKVGDDEDWRKQLLMYCWILRKMGFEAHSGDIVAIMRDHSKRKAETEHDYPKHPVIRRHWDFDDADFESVEREITEWFEKVAQEEQLHDIDLTPCSEEQRWHKEDKWAVKKKGVKRAVRVYSNKQDAHQRAAGENRETKGEPFYVEYRRGEDSKCESYCPVAPFCPHYKALMESRTQESE